MKFLICTSILLLSFGMSASAFACTNFSGEYYDEMDGTYFSMTQDSCNSITYQYEEGPVMRPTDSKDYLVNDYDIVVEEGKVLAHVKIFSSNEFKDEKLVSHDRSEITYTSGGVEIEKVWSETSLDKNNDMVIISHAEDGTKEKTVNKRVK